MITLNQKQEIIIAAFLDGKSQRQIEREYKIDRKTIRKYINKYNESRNALLKNPDNIDNSRLLMDDIVSPPKYDSSNRTKIKLTDEIIERIKFYLSENEKKRSCGQAKQQKKKIDIHEALVEEGYDISYTTVCNTIRDLLSEGAEAYIKAEYEYGDVCEFDWGEAKLYINGELKTLQMAVFTSAKGNYRYSRLFTKQDTACFKESHAYFFDHIGKVYRTVVYDNMKVAVKKFVGPTEKEPTEALLQLSIYYGFRFRFCNARAGNEKGHVERSVEYVRRKAFAFKDRFNSIEEANEYLQNTCNKLNLKPQKQNDNKTALDILNIEKEYMLPGIPMFDAARIEEHRVDKYSTISVDTCRYSVPDRFVGKVVLVKIYSSKIICYCNEIKIAEHNRRYGFCEWSIKLEHFIKTLKKKPGALASSTAMQQAIQDFNTFTIVIISKEKRNL
ncbi:transposase [Fervidicella metallireducens AeB]|uniref:Transposase n=1 Tax=Fervidicella metallireducens AeB TaxID=1403537 RepID=A0A017RTG9_9CLOT|nr:IS21 family transposase [Fervidicella metallireducens]EYE87190.1 transposase [Fervidicella metallireducens AeB]